MTTRALPPREYLYQATWRVRLPLVVSLSVRSSHRGTNLVLTAKRLGFSLTCSPNGRLPSQSTGRPLCPHQESTTRAGTT